MSRTLFRKTLGVPGLLRMVRDGFDRIEDPVASRGLDLTDGLRSALAMSSLKSPSRLCFEPDARDEDRIRSTLGNLYGGGPCAIGVGPA